MGENRELRSRSQAVEANLDRLPDLYAESDLCWFCMTTMHGYTYPSTAGSFVYCEIYTVSGNEVEGVVPTTTASGQYLWAICVGPVPPVNSPVTAKLSNGYFYL